MLRASHEEGGKVPCLPLAAQWTWGGPRLLIRVAVAARATTGPAITGSSEGVEVAFASSVRTTQGLPPHNWYRSSRAETAHRAPSSQFQAAAEEGRVESTYRSFLLCSVSQPRGTATQVASCGRDVGWKAHRSIAWQRAIQARLLLLKAADGRASPSLAPPDFASARLNVPRACDKPLPSASASTSTQHQESSPVGTITAGHALVALGFPSSAPPQATPLSAVVRLNLLSSAPLALLTKLLGALQTSDAPLRAKSQRLLVPRLMSERHGTFEVIPIRPSTLVGPSPRGREPMRRPSPKVPRPRTRCELPSATRQIGET
ncbi:hypothetical protein CSOJ01_14606 [Colletotrichum sojae]|uniref:Uncharacterized protein n=1 Tax=Colletotrichum sojae TaxID=2175907 RepID=A0A8H6MJN1_9PEZI|nr:hypothetical protein CSOJ01_14606 [Colletotrichum sojae]